METRLIGDPIPQGEESFRINGVNVNSGGTLSFRDDGVIYEITPGKSENPEIVVVDLALTCASSKAA